MSEVVDTDWTFLRVADLPHAAGEALGQARLKSAPEDFTVNEILGYELSGDGQHVWLRIQKRDINTGEVAQVLRRLAGVRQVDVGFAGMKDRFAVTEQWFSVDLRGKLEPDWSAIDGPNLRVLEVVRHSRKLKRGGHRANRFSILLRDFDGDEGAISERANAVRAMGFPNYFGVQRFGWNEGNLSGAWRWFKENKSPPGRSLRGIYLSAARAMLFNQVLAKRIVDGTWASALSGDVMMLDGSTSVFAADSGDTDLARRLAELDIHPTGPLPGRGTSLVSGDAAELEARVLAPLAPWCDGLVEKGVDVARRALRVAVRDLEASQADAGLLLEFTLPSGSFATMVAREFVEADATA